MAERNVLTPIDFLSGMALPFLPDPDLPPLPNKPGEVPNSDADNHHNLHPSTDPVFAFQPGSLMPSAGPATRESRIQWTLRPQHVWYHQKYGGPPLPRTPDRQFFWCALTAARYVPEEALAFSGPDIEVVTMNYASRNFLRDSGQLRMADSALVGRFMLEFVLVHGGKEVQPKIVNEFIGLGMSRKRPERQAALARQLLSVLIEPSVDASLHDAYRYAKANSLIAPHLPRSPHTFLQTAITKGEKFPRTVVQHLFQHFVQLEFGPPSPVSSFAT
jgi:hypothetical protein